MRLPISTRRHIYSRDEETCWYCGKDMQKSGTILQERCIDHVLPVSRGGTDEPSNLVCACRSCNSRKRDKTLEEYRFWAHAQDQRVADAIELLRIARTHPCTEAAALIRTAGELLSKVEETTFHGED